MRKCWQVKDIIDLEYFLSAAEDQPTETLRREDRGIYLNHIEPELQQEGADASRHRKKLIYCWLERRRSLEAETADGTSVLPGEIYHEAYNLLKLIFLIVGLISGGGLAFSFLMYRGSQPLNVSVYLGIFVFLQIMLVIALPAIFFLRRYFRPMMKGSILYSLIATLAAEMAARFKSGIFKGVSGRHRRRMQAAIGLVRGKRGFYGAVFYWPAFIVSQIFGVGFNMGVLGATLLRIVSSDLAFGWQSTIQLTARAVYSIVKALALPWSWFLPPSVSYPTLEQIEGSRMLLKEGMYHLATQDLVSWWPFLCLAVGVYGLLPRVMLLTAGVILRNRALARLDFNRAVFDQLIFRMETPILKTRGELIETAGQGQYRPVQQESTSPGRVPLETAVPSSKQGATDALPQDIPRKNAVVLIPEDIFEACRDDDLNRFVYQILGYNVWETHEIELDIDEDSALLDHVAALQWTDNRPHVMVLMEAWQPPIRETLLFFRHIRKILGQDAEVCIGLIGKPVPETLFTPVASGDWEVWRQAVAQLGDPGLRIEKMGE